MCRWHMHISNPNPEWQAPKPWIWVHAPPKKKKKKEKKERERKKHEGFVFLLQIFAAKAYFRGLKTAKQKRCSKLPNKVTKYLNLGI